MRILHPNYVAGETGIILSQEILADGQLSDRWIVQVEGEDIVLSLAPDEFWVLG